MLLCYFTLHLSALDITSWFDKTLVNLIYVCARTVLSKENNIELALSMANYILDLHNNKDVIGDVRIFIAAQKFKKIQELGQQRQAHNVSTYFQWTVFTNVKIHLVHTMICF